MMNKTLTQHLILKDLYLNRWFMIGAIISGTVSLLIAATGQLGFIIGGLTLITTVIGLGIFICINNIVQEREKGSLQFLLSLPVSLVAYFRCKLVSSLLAFLIPWLLLTAGSVLVILAVPGLPDGSIPFALLLMGFFFSNFTILLCMSLSNFGELWLNLTIALTNISITLFIVFVMELPGITESVQTDRINWSTTFFTIMTTELVVIAAALGSSLIILARKRDFQ